MNTSVFAKLDPFLTLDQLMNDTHKLTDAMSAVIGRLAVPDHLKPANEIIHDKHYQLLSDTFRGYRDRLEEYNIKISTKYNYKRLVGDKVKGIPGNIRYYGGHDVTATVHATDIAKAHAQGLPQSMTFTFGTGPKGPSTELAGTLTEPPRNPMRGIFDFFAGVPPQEEAVSTVIPESKAIDRAKLHAAPEAIEVKDFAEMRAKIAEYMEATGGIPTQPIAELKKFNSAEMIAADDAIGWIARNSHDTRAPLKGMQKFIGKQPDLKFEQLPKSVSIEVMANNLAKEAVTNPIMPNGIVHSDAMRAPRALAPESSVVTAARRKASAEAYTPNSSYSSRAYSSSEPSLSSAAAISEDMDFTKRMLNKHIGEWSKNAKLCFSFVTGVSCAALLGLGVHCLTTHNDEDGPDGKRVKRNHLIKGSTELAAGILLMALAKKSHDIIR